jgi:hypothetical protein
MPAGGPKPPPRCSFAMDAAQKAGEIAAGRPIAIPGDNNFTPTVSDVGLTSKDIF